MLTDRALPGKANALLLDISQRETVACFVDFYLLGKTAQMTWACRPYLTHKFAVSISR